MQQILPIRLTKKDTAKALGLSVDGLNRLAKNDPTFPKGLKIGKSRQAHVYFDYEAVIQWHRQAVNSIDSVVNS